VETSVLAAVRSGTDEASQCPYCREPLELVLPSIKCSACGTAQHEGCWIENYGQCTVFQCCGSRGVAVPGTNLSSVLVSAGLLLLPSIVILAQFCPAWVFPAHALAIIALAFFALVLFGG
jgi:hypothetical protein